MAHGFLCRTFKTSGRPDSGPGSSVRMLTDSQSAEVQLRGRGAGRRWRSGRAAGWTGHTRPDGRSHPVRQTPRSKIQPTENRWITSFRAPRVAEHPSTVSRETSQQAPTTFASGTSRPSPQPHGPAGVRLSPTRGAQTQQFGVLGLCTVAFGDTAEPLAAAFGVQRFSGRQGSRGP